MLWTVCQVCLSCESVVDIMSGQVFLSGEPCCGQYVRFACLVNLLWTLCLVRFACLVNMLWTVCQVCLSCESVVDIMSGQVCLSGEPCCGQYVRFACLVNLLWTLCLVRFACLVNHVVDSMSGLPVL